MTVRSKRRPDGRVLGALAVAAGLLLVVSLGAFMLGRQGSPATPPVVTGTPAPETGTPLPTAGQRTSLRIYFARDQLPPIGADVEVEGRLGPGTPETFIRARLQALLTTPAPQAEVVTMSNFAQGDPARMNEVVVEGDLVRVDYTLPEDGWAVRGSAASLGLLQQLVYTATEEPGIRQVLFTQNGGQPMVVDQQVIDAPLAREDVFGYDLSQRTDEIESVDGGEFDVAGLVTANEQISPALGRTMLTLSPRDEGPGFGVRFTARLEPSGGWTPGAIGLQTPWVIRIELPEAHLPADTPPSERVHAGASGPGPILYAEVSRGTRRGPGPEPTGATLSIGVEDPRLWRVSLAPGPDGTTQLIVDVGGPPQTVNRNIAVYGPLPGDEVGRAISVYGAARVFEANVEWRLLGPDGDELARGNTLATLGTSPVWGTFETVAAVFQEVSGPVTLEVFWSSPRDGSPMDVVQIPLTVR